VAKLVSGFAAPVVPKILMAGVNILSLIIPSLSRRGQGRLPVPGYGPTTNANCDFHDSGDGQD